MRASSSWNDESRILSVNLKTSPSATDQNNAIASRPPTTWETRLGTKRPSQLENRKKVYLKRYARTMRMAKTTQATAPVLRGFAVSSGARLINMRIEFCQAESSKGRWRAMAIHAPTTAILAAFRSSPLQLRQLEVGPQPIGKNADAVAESRRDSRKHALDEIGSWYQAGCQGSREGQRPGQHPDRKERIREPCQDWTQSRSSQHALLPGSRHAWTHDRESLPWAACNGAGAAAGSRRARHLLMRRRSTTRPLCALTAISNRLPPRRAR